jgi:hypothetical protein
MSTKDDSTILKLPRGSYLALPVTVTTGAGVPIDLTDKRLTLIAKKRLNDPDETETLLIDVNTFTNPTLGQAIIEFTSSDTDVDDDTPFQMQVTLSNDDITGAGPGTEPMIFGRGTVYFEQNVYVP